MTNKAEIITGNSHTDERGTINFIYDFHFKDIKRFYIVNHPDTTTVRAWQGHKIEKKHFYVTKGTFLICWVEIDNWDKPSDNLAVNKMILKENGNKLLILPGGFANGIKALEPD